MIRYISVTNLCIFFQHSILKWNWKLYKFFSSVFIRCKGNRYSSYVGTCSGSKSWDGENKSKTASCSIVPCNVWFCWYHTFIKGFKKLKKNENINYLKLWTVMLIIIIRSDHYNFVNKKIITDSWNSLFYSVFTFY